MEGECFLNPCFAPRQVYHPVLPCTRERPRMSSAKKYEDPKLNARCLVILKRLDVPPHGLLELRSSRKPRVFKVYSDSEAENTNDVSAKKKHRRRKVKGTKRLFQLSDSEEDLDGNSEMIDFNLSNIHDDSHLNKLATSPSAFVVEKSVSTPEGKRLLKSTISSMDNRTDEINSLTRFRLCQMEEITLSSDDEEAVFRNTSKFALPLTSSINEKKEYLEIETMLAPKSDGIADDDSTVPVPTTPDIRGGPIAVERRMGSPQATENVEEKLQALLACKRFKPNGKSTKPTSPRAISRGWRAIGGEFRKKENKNRSSRKIVTEQQDLSGYLTCVSEAEKKNLSGTTLIAQSVPVHAAANGSQKHSPAHKPRVPLPTIAKAKITAMSRGDRLTADFLDGANQPKIQKKELPKTPSVPRKIPTKHPSNINLLEMQPTAKTTSPKLPESDKESFGDDLNDSLTNHHPSIPRFKRVSRIPSNESPGGSGPSTSLSANSRKSNKDRGKQLTARNKANLALKSGILEIKRSLDGMQGLELNMTHSLLLRKHEDRRTAI